MPKFFVNNNQIEDEKITIIGEDVKHIVSVLRLKIDDEILICDKQNGISYNTKIDEILKEKVICKIECESTDIVESNIKVSIFQGLPKADKMEYIIQKCTELGAVEFIPVALKRCIVKLSGKDEEKKIERWQKIAEVAAKQSGRDIIPDVKNVINLGKLKEFVSEFDLFIVAYEAEKESTLKAILQKYKEGISENIEVKIGVVVGPEGGLDIEEVEALKESGAKIITLGNRILRTETAPIAIVSNIMYEFES